MRCEHIGTGTSPLSIGQEIWDPQLVHALIKKIDDLTLGDDEGEGGDHYAAGDQRDGFGG